VNIKRSHAGSARCTGRAGPLAGLAAAVLTVPLLPGPNFLQPDDDIVCNGSIANAANLFNIFACALIIGGDGPDQAFI